MTHRKIYYWSATGLMAAFMLMASIPDLLQAPEAKTILGHLGYPTYLLPFLGAAKTLGVIAILAPGLRRLKEWAYAGLVFDVTGALYSHLASGDPASGWMFAAVGLLLVSTAYVVYRRTQEPAGVRAFAAEPTLTSPTPSTAR